MPLVFPLVNRVVKVTRSRRKTCQLKLSFLIEWDPQSAAAQAKATAVAGRILRTVILNPAEREALVAEVVKEARKAGFHA